MADNRLFQIDTSFSAELSNISIARCEAEYKKGKGSNFSFDDDTQQNDEYYQPWTTFLYGEDPDKVSYPVKIVLNTYKNDKSIKQNNPLISTKEVTMDMTHPFLIGLLLLSMGDESLDFSFYVQGTKIPINAYPKYEGDGKYLASMQHEGTDLAFYRFQHDEAYRGMLTCIKNNHGYDEIDNIGITDENGKKYKWKVT